jgi:hypothetical protein
MQLRKLIGETNLSNLSKSEQHEVRYLIVSFKSFMEILVKNFFLNLIFLLSIILFFLFYVMKVIDFRSPYGIPSSQMNLIFIIPFSAVCGIILVAVYIILRFHFDSWNGLKKFSTLFCMQIQRMALGFSIIFNLLMILIFITVLLNGKFPGVVNLILYLLIFYTTMGVGFLIIFLYTESYLQHKEFFSYAKNQVEHLQSYNEKIKAYNTIWLAYRTYVREFNLFFRKEALSILKHTNLILLSEEILKLDVNQPEINQNKITNKKTEIIKILSDLENIDPLTDTEKFTNIMNNIENTFNNEEFLKKYNKKLISTGRHHSVRPASIYTILFIISTIYGILKLLPGWTLF